jgi:hypothetical protein
MKKRKHLHTEFVKFLIESEGQGQREKEKKEIEIEETEIEEVLPDEIEGKEDEEEDELNADEIIEKLIQKQNKYKKQYEDILQGRKR